MQTLSWAQEYIRLEAEDLKVELAQAREEGRELPEAVVAEFERLIAQGDVSGRADQKRIGELLDTVISLPFRADYEYSEPSDVEGILAECEGYKTTVVYDYAQVEDLARGAWLGRMAGCLLGKPVEGWMSDRLEGMLRATDNWPLRRYLPFESVGADVREKYKMERRFWWIDTVDGMPEDDDVNYSFIGKLVLEHGGSDFTPVHVAFAWQNELPAWHTFTAERVAQRNFLLDMEPPTSALYRNPYREWIGAQIRADFFGWASPGNPEQAARWAWRDACVSHYKNGIYGEMWVAAMLAIAAIEKDVRLVIIGGLAYVPTRSRLHAALSRVVKMYDSGMTHEAFMSDFRERWDDTFKHHWCHVIANAEIVASSLLWGAGDFGQTICMAVQPGFDTDCNGATCGSVLGVLLGASKLPEEWVKPLGDKVTLGLVSFHQQSIAKLVSDSAALIRKVNNK